MTAMTRLARIGAILALGGLGGGVGPAAGAELQAKTIAAFDRYVEATNARMVAELGSADRFLYLSTRPDPERTTAFERLRRGEILVERLSTADAGRPIPIPGGLVHHWVGLAFLPGVTLDRAVALLQDYDRHAVVYAPRIARSTLRTRADDLFRFHLRFFMQKGI